MAQIHATATVDKHGTLSCLTDCRFDLITGVNIQQAKPLGDGVYSLWLGPFMPQFKMVPTPIPGAGLLFASALALVLATTKRRVSRCM